MKAAGLLGGSLGPRSPWPWLSRALSLAEPVCTEFIVYGALETHRSSTGLSGKAGFWILECSRELKFYPPIFKQYVKNNLKCWEVCWWSGGWDPGLSLPRPGLSLVGELRFHKPCSQSNDDDLNVLVPCFPTFLEEEHTKQQLLILFCRKP